MQNRLSESGFQTQLIASLFRAGAKILNVHGHAMQKAGWADLQIYSPFWTGHTELKCGARQATPLQAECGLQLVKRGTPWFVLRPFGEFGQNIRAERWDRLCLGELSELSGVLWRDDGRKVLEWLRHLTSKHYTPVYFPKSLSQ